MRIIITEILVTLAFALAALSFWLMLELPPYAHSDTILEWAAAIAAILALFALGNTVRLFWVWAMDRPEPLEEWEDIVDLRKEDVVE